LETHLAKRHQHVSAPYSPRLIAAFFNNPCISSVEFPPQHVAEEAFYTRG
jgi:hypothetical protein